MNGSERMVGENVKLRKKLARALESAAAMRGERNHAIRQSKRLMKENVEMSSRISRLRNKLTVRSDKLAKLRRYETLLRTLVKKVG